MQLANVSLTLEEVKNLLLGLVCFEVPNLNPHPDGLNEFAIGQTVIIRTYDAGVWCGTLAQKAGKEVILHNARRMWRWWCKESISLSGVVQYGIRQDRSKIAPPVGQVWLEAIEILPITGEAAQTIMEAPIVQAE